MYTIQLSQENIGRTLSGVNHSNIFFDPYPRVTKIKTKINKWDPIKLKSFCTAKETINKLKRQPNTEWERLVSKIYKQKIQLNNRKTNHLIQKWVEDLNRHFYKENIQIAKKHMKRCSTSLIITEMQIKITMRYHLTLVRVAIIKKSTNNKCWRGSGENGILLYCWWECKSVQPLWRTIWSFL